jgi:cytochrome c
MRQSLMLVAIILLSLSCVATGRGQIRRPSVWDGIYTVAQADRGHLLYDVHCASCHGDNLEGMESQRPVDLQPDLPWRGTPPLVGRKFRAGWHDETIGDLLERLKISMPQQAPGSLSWRQDADILAYILWRNSYPSGRQELSSDKATLDMVPLEAW